MENATVVDALLRKRGELLASVQGIQSAIYHIDQTPALIGYTGGEGRAPKGRRFANGELTAIVGEAERAGAATVQGVVQYVMSAKGYDLTDEKLKRNIAFSVRDVRKRMSARGV